LAKLKEQSSLSFYFTVYGGWKELYRSEYSRFACIIALICFPYWSSNLWWDDVIGVIPNLLGFTLGGYAMLMAFGEPLFQKQLAAKKAQSENSALIQINSTFVHFIVLQIASILVAFICKSYYFVPTGKIAELINEYDQIFNAVTIFIYFVGFYIFIYALLSALAATFAILRLMKVYDVFLRIEGSDESDRQESSQNSHDNE
jgi:hypothetical protein